MSASMLEKIYKEVLGLKTHMGSVETRLDSMDKRFDGIDTRLDGIDTRLDGIDTRLDGIDTRLDGMDSRFDGMDSRFDSMDSRFDGMDSRFDSMDSRFDGMQISIDENTDAIHILNSRVDQNSIEINLLRRDMIRHFQGLGNFLINMDRNIASHGDRILQLEQAGNKPTKQSRRAGR